MPPLMNMLGQLAGLLLRPFRHRDEPTLSLTPITPPQPSSSYTSNPLKLTPAEQAEPSDRPFLQYRQQNMNLDNDVDWFEVFDPPQRYQIEYADRNGEHSVREVFLAKKGRYARHVYLGVYDKGRFKTFRRDHILKMEAIGHDGTRSNSRTAHQRTSLPQWPAENAVFRIAQTVGTKRWTVNLNEYTCTCPEKRTRAGRGCPPKMLGMVCPHMAQAILENLPADANWPPEIISYLKDPESLKL